MPSPSSASEPPELRDAPPPPAPPFNDPPADASVGVLAAEPEERSSALLVILTAMVNFVFALQVGSARDLTEWRQRTAESAGEVAGGGWFWVWPGLAIVWGAAWLGFTIFALRKQFRRALIVFLLTAAAWFLPVVLFIFSFNA